MKLRASGVDASPRCDGGTRGSPAIWKNGPAVSGRALARYPRRAIVNFALINSVESCGRVDKPSVFGFGECEGCPTGPHAAEKGSIGKLPSPIPRSMHSDASSDLLGH